MITTGSCYQRSKALIAPDIGGPQVSSEVALSLPILCVIWYLCTGMRRAFCVREVRMRSGDQSINYRTHILVGVRADGVTTIIEDWPHVPTQVDVQEAIDGARGSFANFALCTPCSFVHLR